MHPTHPMFDPVPASVREEMRSRAAGSDGDDGSEFRTARRLLRLLKLALGTLVSFLTALKLLGVL